MMMPSLMWMVMRCDAKDDDLTAIGDKYANDDNVRGVVAIAIPGKQAVKP